GRRGGTDTTVDQDEIIRAPQLVLTADVTRVSHYIVAAIEEQVGDRRANPLRCSRHHDGLLLRIHVNSCLWAVQVGAALRRKTRHRSTEAIVWRPVRLD